MVAAALLALGVLLGAERPLLLLPVGLLSWVGLRRFTLFLALGAGLVALRSVPASDFDELLQAADGPVVLDGVIALAPELRPDAEILTLELLGLAVAPPGLPAPARGRVRVTLPRAVSPDDPARTCGMPGDRVRVLVRAHPSGPPLHAGEAAMRRVFDRRGITGFARARAHAHCRRFEPAPSGGFGVELERARARLHEVIERALPGRAAGVVRAFATGDRSGIPPELDRAFLESGLSHLLAVSGLNLAIIAGLFVVGVAWGLRRSAWVSLGPGVARTAAACALPLVLLYSYLVGLSASAVRAALMMGGLLLAALLRRVPDPASSVALAVVGMLALDPWTLWDVSFQLSLASVVALLSLYPPLRRGLTPRLDERPWWWRAPIEVTLASLAATLGTAPFVAYHFQRVSLVGLVANVPAAPLGSFVLVPLSLLGGALASASDTLGRPVLELARLAAELLILLAEGAREVPAAALSVPAPSLAEAGLALALVYALALPSRWRGRVALGSLLLLVGLTGAETLARRLRTELEVSFLPVGQGDSTLLELPGGAVWLVDVGPPGRDGPGAARRVIAPYLRQRRITRIDTVVLTHPHADHIGGLAELASELPIGRVLWNGDEREAPPELIAALRALPNQVVDACAPPETHGGVELRFLGPSPRDGTPPVVNDGSLVLRVRAGAQTLLITGDAEADAERALVARRGDGLRAQVLKAGHHGSRTSSTEVFLDAVQPSHAVLSLGRNNGFGFPHPEVLERLAVRGVQVHRTDQDGVIRLVMDEAGVRFSHFVR